MGGVASLKFRGVPFLSKAHGSADLRLHAALHFDGAPAPLQRSEDVSLRLRGSPAALVFTDEPSADAATTPAATAAAPIALVKAAGKAELHLLGGGRLLLDDGSDARECSAASNGGSTGGVHHLGPGGYSAGTAVEFRPGPTGARVLLELAEEDALDGNEAPGDGSQSLTLAVSLEGGSLQLRVHGGGTLRVDSADVRTQQASCR